MVLVSPERRDDVRLLAALSRDDVSVTSAMSRHVRGLASVCAEHTSAVVTATLAAPTAERPWLVAPGLFAGGGVDVMTAYLLATLAAATPAPFADGARVLDFCCGSGVIAATLLARAPRLRVHLLDADALALRCARRNVRGAAGFVLSDAWRRVPPGAPPLPCVWKSCPSLNSWWWSVAMGGSV